MNPKTQSTSHKLFITGVVFGSLTFLVFAGLLFAALFDRHVGADDRYLVPIVLAIGAGLSAGALGGSAALEGVVPIPWLGNSAPRMALAGGSAVMIIVLLLGRSLYPSTTAEGPEVRLSRVTGVVVGSNPDRVMVEATFDPVQLPPDRRLFLIAASDASCVKILAEGRVDHPLQGTMRLFLLARREQVVCAKLVVKNPSGVLVAATPASAVTW